MNENWLWDQLLAFQNSIEIAEKRLQELEGPATEYEQLKPDDPFWERRRVILMKEIRLYALLVVSGTRYERAKWREENLSKSFLEEIDPIGLFLAIESAIIHAIKKQMPDPHLPYYDIAVAKAKLKVFKEFLGKATGDEIPEPKGDTQH